MAQSQIGLGATMKRGGRMRTLRLTTPYIYVTNEQDLPRPSINSEVGMSKTTGFVEAPRESTWFEALSKGDCRQLMNLLEENPCRVVEKGDRGFTILHADAWRGCLKLLDQVFDLFGDTRRFVDGKVGIKFSLDELLKAEHVAKERRMGAVGLTAAEYSWWSMGTFKARHYLVDGRRSKHFASYQSEIFRSCIDEAEDDEGSLSPRTVLLEILGHHRGLLPQREREEFGEDVEYNFVADCEELRFHHACGKLDDQDVREYVEAVIEGCVGKGPHVLTYLFQLRNAQGQTPLHVAAHKNTCHILVPLIPRGQGSGENAECLNMRDSRGWTVLHLLSALQNGTRGLKELLKDGRADVNVMVGTGPIISGTALHVEDVNARMDNIQDSRGGTELYLLDARGFEGSLEYERVDMDARVHGYPYPSATALHLAVLNNNSEALKLLSNDRRADVNATLRREVVLDEILPVSRLDSWTALQLAAMVAGSPEVVKVLAACPRVKDAGLRQKGREGLVRLHRERDNIGLMFHRKISAVHLAAAFGDPETLRIFMTNREFDPLVTCDGATALHFAVASSQPRATPSMNDLSYTFNCLMEIGDFGDIFSYDDAKHKDIKQEDARTSSYEGREACINILVQAGPLDVWHKDDYGNFPEPGRSASSAYYLSWQRKVASETLEAKKGLNEAGNAISVVAALVAIASYVGPLQPPLGYANDLVQSSNLLVRIFMVTNSTSFYLAIASIMFAVVPSLPMPQEGMYKEWQRTRHTIGIAIGLLLMYVLGIIISFAVASNAVVSTEDSWPHGGLAFYPEVVGGLLCLIGIIWFFIRLVRFMFPKSVIISQSL